MLRTPHVRGPPVLYAHWLVTPVLLLLALQLLALLLALQLLALLLALQLLALLLLLRVGAAVGRGRCARWPARGRPCSPRGRRAAPS
jgi:hypothetical protein